VIFLLLDHSILVGFVPSQYGFVICVSYDVLDGGSLRSLCCCDPPFFIWLVSRFQKSIACWLHIFLSQLSAPRSWVVSGFRPFKVVDFWLFLVSIQDLGLTQLFGVIISSIYFIGSKRLLLFVVVLTREFQVHGSFSWRWSVRSSTFVTIFTCSVSMAVVTWDPPPSPSYPHHYLCLTLDCLVGSKELLLFVVRCRELMVNGPVFMLIVGSFASY
jgi:hypothetical protein